MSILFGPAFYPFAALALCAVFGLVVAVWELADRRRRRRAERRRIAAALAAADERRRL